MRYTCIRIRLSTKESSEDRNRYTVNTINTNSVEYKKNQVEYWMMKKRMMVYEEYKQDNPQVWKRWTVYSHFYRIRKKINNLTI